MKGDPKVTDIRALKYAPSGEIFYKLKLTDEYKLLNQRRNARINNIPFNNIPNLYNERRKITKKKVLRFTQCREITKTIMTTFLMKPKIYLTLFDYY
ncbi:unnamed protein product [Parnassius apollo]|uniref:(apollo) hypothetical protein n=1 Tax=Parnassius apollo TaxID=110799 RepID=A0A8S3XUD3_PARAO|nr:unnamed protein product [Parnassius apollo]